MHSCGVVPAAVVFATLRVAYSAPRGYATAASATDLHTKIVHATLLTDCFGSTCILFGCTAPSPLRRGGADLINYAAP